VLQKPWVRSPSSGSAAASALAVAKLGAGRHAALSRPV
jgi:hypothetical protein